MSVLRRQISRLFRANNSGVGGDIPGRTFFAPLRTSLVAVASGSGTPTFTRATTATVMAFPPTAVPGDPLQVTSVASGEARFYGARRVSQDVWSDTYADGTPIAASTLLGYLAEGARTNVCLQSQDLSTSWILSSASDVDVTTNVFTAPDGTLTMDKIREKATTNLHYIYQSATLPVSPCTFSMYFAAAERSIVYMYIHSAATAIAYFNLSSGTIGTVSGTGSPSAKITLISPGIYRCQLTGTPPSTTSAFGTGVTTTDGVLSYAGTATFGLYGWGGQVEAGSFASSYIPTTTATVTRNADVLTYPYASNANTAAGTAYAELTTLWSTAAAASFAITMDDSGSGPLLVASGSASTVVRVDDNLNAATKSGLTAMATAVRKRASSWGAAGIAVTGDGVAPATASFDNTMGATTSIGVGCRTGGAGNWFGTIRNLKIYGVQLSSAQLQGLTT